MSQCYVIRTLAVLFMFHFSILKYNRSLHSALCHSVRCIFLSLKMSDLFDNGNFNIVLFESLHKLPLNTIVVIFGKVPQSDRFS